jgi:hypothetical protein
MADNTELEAAIRLLAEGEGRQFEQAELIEKLRHEGKHTEAAENLLCSMRSTLDEIRTHIDYLRDTANRKE